MYFLLYSVATFLNDDLYLNESRFHIKGIFSSIWDGLKEYFSTIIGAVKGVADVFLGWFGTNWETVWNGVKTFFEGIWNGISSFFEGIWNGISTFCTTVWNELLQT